MVIKEGRDALSPGPQQELVPLVGTMHCETRSLPLILLGVGGEDGNLHGDGEWGVTLLGGFVFREGGDEFGSLQSAIDIVGCGS